MPTFLTIHHAPGLTREEFAQNAPDVLAGKFATMRHVYVNSLEGFIVTVYEAKDQEALEAEFEHLGFPYTESHEIHIDMSHDGLQAMVGTAPADPVD